MCISLLVYASTHNNEKQDTLFHSLALCTCDQRTVLDAPVTFFLNTPIHTHTYMLTNKHENICTPQIQNGMQVVQSPLVLHSTSTVEMGSSGTTKRLLKMTA